MYAGHFAAALALKAARPAAPTWGLVLGAGLLDVAFGALVILGLEGAEPDYNVSHLLHIPWSHALVSALILGGAYAMVFVRRGLATMTVLFLAVLSHWSLDVLAHRPDMPLWPLAGPRLGYAHLFGGVSGWFEMAFVVLAFALYVARARAVGTFGGRPIMTLATLSILLAMGLAA